jgi:hypothetical protein
MKFMVVWKTVPGKYKTAPRRSKSAPDQFLRTGRSGAGRNNSLQSQALVLATPPQATETTTQNLCADLQNISTCWRTMASSVVFQVRAPRPSRFAAFASL